MHVNEISGICNRIQTRVWRLHRGFVRFSWICISRIVTSERSLIKLSCGSSIARERPSLRLIRLKLDDILSLDAVIFVLTHRSRRGIKADILRENAVWTLNVDQFPPKIIYSSVNLWIDIFRKFRFNCPESTTKDYKKHIQRSHWKFVFSQGIWQRLKTYTSFFLSTAERCV